MNVTSESEESKELYGALDTLDQNKLAASLPFALVGSLILSFTALLSTKGMSLPISSADGIQLPLKEIFSTFILVSNAIVCYMFTKTTLFGSSTSDATDSATQPSTLQVIIPIALVALSFLIPPGGVLLWPMHNIINACICIQVGRVLQLNQLIPVLIAIIGLMFYDVIAVTTTQSFTDNGASVMEAIATAKLGLSQVAGQAASSASTASSSSIVAPDSALASTITAIAQMFTHPSFHWRPGLFEVAVNGRVSDALGLGDIVFPAILTGWLYRFESDQAPSNAITDTLIVGTASVQDVSTDVESVPTNTADRQSIYPLYNSALLGYIIGCVLNEIFMGSAGTPALLYLVPSMLIAVGIEAVRRGKVSDMLAYNNNSNGTAGTVG